MSAKNFSTEEGKRNTKTEK